MTCKYCASGNPIVGPRPNGINAGEAAQGHHAVGGQGGSSSSSSGGPHTALTLPPGLAPSTSSSSIQHGAAPAVGGLAYIPQGPVLHWSVHDMLAYLNAISLAHLGPAIIAHKIDGYALVQLTEADLERIGIGPVQWKKIMLFLPGGLGLLLLARRRIGTQ